MAAIIIQFPVKSQEPPPAAPAAHVVTIRRAA